MSKPITTTATEIPSERVDKAVADLDEVIDAAKEAERAERKERRAAKRAKAKAKVTSGFRKTGRVIIDTDLRDVGHGVRSGTRAIVDHLPRVRFERASTEES